MRKSVSRKSLRKEQATLIEKARLAQEVEKIKLDQERMRLDRKQATEIEKARLAQELEKIKLDQEQQRINLLPGGQSPTPNLNIEKKICLVPPFREADVDTFFLIVRAGS